MHVYMIICDADISPVTGSGKYYVGKTVTETLTKYLQRKFSYAKTARCKSHLYNALRKYPNRSDWRIHSLMSTLPSDPQIKKWEMEMIALTNCRNPEVGYNLTAGGDDGFGVGRKHTPESIERMRLARLGVLHTDEAKAKMRASHTGLKQSPEHIAAMVASKLGYIVPATTRKKISEAHVGNVWAQHCRWHRDRNVTKATCQHCEVTQ